MKRVDVEKLEALAVKVNCICDHCDAWQKDIGALIADAVEEPLLKITDRPDLGPGSFDVDYNPPAVDSLREAAQIVVDRWDEDREDDYATFVHAMWAKIAALRAVLAVHPEEKKQ